MVARGKEKADIVFKNAKVFNVFIGDFIIGDVAICGNVVAGIGNYKGEVEIDGRVDSFIYSDVHGGSKDAGSILGRLFK